MTVGHRHDWCECVDIPYVCEWSVPSLRRAKMGHVAMCFMFYEIVVLCHWIGCARLVSGRPNYSCGTFDDVATHHTFAGVGVPPNFSTRPWMKMSRRRLCTRFLTKLFLRYLFLSPSCISTRASFFCNAACLHALTRSDSYSLKKTLHTHIRKHTMHTPYRTTRS